MWETPAFPASSKAMSFPRVSRSVVLQRCPASMSLSAIAKRKAPHPDQQAFFVALGRRIKELRKERNWSLNYMFIVHGFVPSQWQSFEKGKVMTINSMLRIADIFDQSLNTLVRSPGEFPKAQSQKQDDSDLGEHRRGTTDGMAGFIATCDLHRHAFRERTHRIALPKRSSVAARNCR